MAKVCLERFNNWSEKMKTPRDSLLVQGARRCLIFPEAVEVVRAYAGQDSAAQNCERAKNAWQEEVGK